VEAIGHFEKTLGRVQRRRRRQGTTQLVAIEFGVLGIPAETQSSPERGRENFLAQERLSRGTPT
jgi:hypothetical protein